MGILIVPLRRLSLSTNSVDIANTISAPRNESQSQLPAAAPLADMLPKTDETLIYGKKKAMKAIIAAPPAITYPRLFSSLILSVKFIENQTFLIATRSHQ